MSSQPPSASNFTPDGAPSPENGAARAERWTPELARLRDIDGAGVTAALVNVLAYKARHSDTRPGFSPESHGLAGIKPGGLKAGDLLVLMGGVPDELGRSVFLKVVHALEDGAPQVPEKRLHARLTQAASTLANADVLHAGRVLAAGGLLAAAAEMLVTAGSDLGLKMDLTAFGATRSDTLLFGEHVDRVLVAVAAERVGTVLSESHTDGVPAAAVGEVTSLPEFVLFTRRLTTRWPLEALRNACQGVS